MPSSTQASLGGIKIAFATICLLRLAAQWYFHGPASTLFESRSPSIYSDSEERASQEIEPSISVKAATPSPYLPSMVEQYVIENAKELGYDKKSNADSARGCDIWKKESRIFNELDVFRHELDDYKKRLVEFPGAPIPDVRLATTPSKKDEICSSLELHPDGLPGIFPSGQLSQLPNGTGFLEPLLPPMRSPGICFSRNLRKYLMDMGYMVHDFANVCQQLQRTSRIILVDMGASLEFHDSFKLAPAVYLAELYRKFGMPFDHIYAFEVTKTKPAKVYQRIPEHLMASYHWINVGVDASPQAKLNPLKMLLRNFNADDWIVVKLDIDSPGIEEQLAYQIRDTPELAQMIDQFFFEHHVFLKELNGQWRKGNNRGSIEESLTLFQSLRKKGTAAHFWV